MVIKNIKLDDRMMPISFSSMRDDTQLCDTLTSYDNIMMAGQGEGCKCEL